MKKKEQLSTTREKKRSDGISDRFTRRKEEQILKNFSDATNRGRFDQEIAGKFLQYRPDLRESTVQAIDVTDKADRYWLINAIEQVFQKRGTRVELNSYLAYPDKRIDGNIETTTLQRILEVIKQKLRKRKN